MAARWDCLSRQLPLTGQGTGQDFCTQWSQAGGLDLDVVARLPTAAEAVELYSWGLVAVLGPAILAWIGRVLVEAISNVGR